MSDHGSTALAVTYIGYGFKNPTNLGLHFFLSVTAVQENMRDHPQMLGFPTKEILVRDTLDTFQCHSD